MVVKGQDLESFLSVLEKSLIQDAQDLIHVLQEAPSWAVSCSDLFYTDKSIPQEFDQPGQLFISYKIDQSNVNHHPKVVQLRGKSKDDKQTITRYLKVEQKASSVTISSQHVSNFIQDKNITTYSGSGKNFKTALNEYFSKCDLKSNYIYSTEGNIQMKGDAFLFQKQLSQRGCVILAKEIVNVVREIFNLIPSEKHLDVLALIKKAVKHFKELLQKGELKPLAHHYDPRLWMIVESICEHLDPLEKTADPKRKQHRDKFIAECCSNLLRGEEIMSSLEAYFKAVEMHREMMNSDQGNHIEDELKKILEEYRNLKQCPEIKTNHSIIKQYHQKCQQHKKNRQRPAP